MQWDEFRQKNGNSAQQFTYRTGYKPCASQPRQRNHNQGFSLVEVMVAIVLGLLLTAATLQLFTGNSATFRTVGNGRVQEKCPLCSIVITVKSYG